MKLRTPLLAVVSFWFCAVLILVLSLAPPAPELPTTGWDKSNHLLGFAALSVLGRAAYPRRTAPLIVGLLLYGGAIEALQSLTPYRLAEWADWLADGIGVAIGYAVSLAWRRRQNGKNREPTGP
jgi:VanZ family protein